MEKLICSKKSGNALVKIYKSSDADVYPFYIHIENISGRMAGYCDYPIKYTDGTICYDHPQLWNRSVKNLVAFMYKVLEMLVKQYNHNESGSQIFPNFIMDWRVRKFMVENNLFTVINRS